MSVILRQILLFLALFITGQTWGISVAHHQFDAGNVGHVVNEYVYDATVNLQVCCGIHSQGQNANDGYLLALTGDFLATKSGASSAKQAANLKEHLRQADKYGQGGIKELQNGKNRYYSNVSPANKPGEMAGRRTVREWDPATGNKRTWHETVDHNGSVRIVRPQRSDSAKTHYQFDTNGNYTGKF